MKKLKIICLVKIIPDVKNFSYDYEKNILIRENKKSVVNPDDVCAIAAALRMKEKNGAEVTVVCMGPESAAGHLENLIRCGVDQAFLITDNLYRGSDTYVTGRILAKGIEQSGYDMIFSGVHSLDGDTAHVPAQVAELLDLHFMSNIVKVEEETTDERLKVEVRSDDKSMLFSVKLPALLGISSESKYKLPYIKYENLKKDVSDKIHILTNAELQFPETEVGLKGSKTKVVKTYPKQLTEQKKVVVQTDEDGIEYVYQFLKEKGFL